MPVDQEAPQFRFREILAPTKTLVVLLAVGVLLEVVSLLSSSMQAELLGQPIIDPLAADANDRREQMIGFAQLVVLLATTVVFGRWIVHAHKNVRAMGAEGLTVSPGWALGYFFVPIVNLWKPYRAMRELWGASHSPSSWGPAEAGTIVQLWWVCWLGGNMIGQVVLRRYFAAETIEDLKRLTTLQMVDAVVGVALGLVAIALVRAIARAQTRAVRLASIGR